MTEQPSSSATTREALERACQESSLIRVLRGSFDSEGENGYPGALSSDLFLLRRICPEIRANGCSILRIADITELEDDRDNEEFIEQALALRGDMIGPPPVIDLTSIVSALRTAGRSEPLICVHREIADPGVCHIGKLVSVSEETLSLVEITTNAEWEEELTYYRTAEVTRIDFGGGYEEALAMVAGRCPWG